MIKTANALAVIGTCALTACQSVNSAKQESLENDPRRGQAIDSVCFAGRLSGLHEISDQALVLRDSPNKSFLIEVGFCPNLNRLEGLRISDPSNCLKRGDRLEVFDTPLPRTGVASDQPDLCIVNRIFEWNENAIAKVE